MNLTKREFFQVLGAGTMAGMGLGAYAQADVVTAANGLYDIPKFGNVSFLHMTDCHAQLKPIHFREPSINLGLGSMKGNLPHLVGEHLLKVAKVRPGTAEAHALTYLDYEQAARYGVAPGNLLRSLEQMIEGERITQVIEGNRRFDLLVRLPEAARGPQALADLLIETPTGAVPLSKIASVEESDGPNQVSRENSRRRIVLSANTDNSAAGRDMSKVIADIRAELAAKPLPEGYFTALEGQFQAQEQASRLIALLAAVSLTMIFMVLYSRYRSTALTLIIMGNIPLALVGSVIALWISGQPLSVAALVGFITLTGIATRNGILKISHYINLCAFENESFGQHMIVRGSLERLTPVLMTALVAAFALLPLLLSADAPGKEVLHPVAVVIFGGLVSSTLLDSLLTPLMFWLWGRPALERLLADQSKQSF